MGKRTIKYIKGARVNREYSWINFNERVLDQAERADVPLLERCKFLSIYANNLDEFYMVRVGSLQSELAHGTEKYDEVTKMSTSEELAMILARTKSLNKRRKSIFNKLIRELKANKIYIDTASKLTKARQKALLPIYQGQILPLLSPVVIDSKRPLSSFNNLATYIIYELERGGNTYFGVVPVTKTVKRIYKQNVAGHRFIAIEDILLTFSASIFEGYTVKSASKVRVTKNADINIKEESMLEDTNDYSKFMKEQVNLRGRLDPVRLEVSSLSDKILGLLTKKIKLNPAQIFVADDYFDYKFFFELGKYLPEELVREMSYKSFRPRLLLPREKKGNLISEVLAHDLVSFYPYDGMDTFIQLLRECAVSDDVKTIKITIYRLADKSKVVDALKLARKKGKQVTATIELGARFDEESNMRFADVLRDAGCTILYGIGDYKVHSKVASVVLSTADGIKYITHFGTGNYNESTAKLYTDLNIITGSSELGFDAALFFNNLSIYNTKHTYNKLWVAPYSLKSNIIKSIDGEIANALDGKSAQVFIKVNSVSDTEIISKLVEASRAGVKVKLVVRGICCLLPAVKGKTDNVEIISIVGRFLEHARIYSFGVGDERKTYISSADFMHRNLCRRVEIAVPVLDRECEEKVYNILENSFRDNVNAYRLNADGSYTQIANEECQADTTKFDIQTHYVKNPL